MNWSWRAVPVVLFLAVVGWGAWSVLGSVEEPTEEDWWQPVSGLSWQYQESGPVDILPGVDLYVLDTGLVTAADIDALRTGGAGVLCSFEAGFVTPGASSQVDLVPEQAVGDAVDGISGARWLDIRDTEGLEPYLDARLDEVVGFGCDGVAPRSVDAWQHPTAFEFRGNDQLRYIRFIADMAHEKGLAFALHNDAEQVERLVGDVDLIVSTGCLTNSRCDLYQPALDLDVPVHVVETRANESRFCAVGAETGIEFIGKEPGFGPDRRPC
ncbi:MAG: endo alpha-1,4 polygalactosaminidase [Actinomycetia bacterium]|nr:endo alpha-1,4 polygalactosaminidase [Actinomycetes bacterium]